MSSKSSLLSKDGSSSPDVAERVSLLNGGSVKSEAAKAAEPPKMVPLSRVFALRPKEGWKMLLGSVGLVTFKPFFCFHVDRWNDLQLFRQGSHFPLSVFLSQAALVQGGGLPAFSGAFFLSILWEYELSVTSNLIPFEFASRTYAYACCPVPSSSFDIVTLNSRLPPLSFFLFGTINYSCG